MTRVIAVCSQKGGVGKTTTAINLAAFLHESGYRTLIVDLDPQANATSGLSVKPADVHPIEVLRDDPSAWGRVSSYTPLRNLLLVPSGGTGTLPEIPDADPAWVLRLRQGLNAQTPPFSYVIVDTPPSLGPILVLALHLADSVLIPVQCEYFAMEGLSQMLPLIDLVGRSRGRRLEIEGILVTMFSEEIELSVEVLREVETHFPDKVLRTVIPRDVRLAESASFGQPICEYDYRSRGSWAFLNLAKEIIEHGTEQEAGPRSGFTDSPERRVGAKRRV